jgi:alkylation response protein AidB-like acyl-CoA dehydrogenase
MASGSLPGLPLADDEDAAALRALARRVAHHEIAPLAATWDEEERFADEALDALRRADLLGLTVGTDVGGHGLGDLEAAIVLEELARVDVSSAIIAQLCFNGPPRTIEHLGGPALRQRWLPRVAAGELLCIGITEPDAGSAATNLRARLEPDGEGFRLKAYKNYVTGGHRAVACLVWCRFPGSPPTGGRGIGAVVVDLAAPGVSVVGTHRKMGLRGCTEAELAFDDVRIGPDDVLVPGDPGTTAGLKILLAHLNHERCGNAAMCLGAARGALERAMAHMADRTVGDRRLADLQGLQWKVADLAVAIDGAWLLLRRALALAGRHGTPPPLESAMAKLACNETAKRVCDEAIQLLGGYGYSREHPLERAYRDVRGLCIGAGTTEVQRNVIARCLFAGQRPPDPGWLPPST